MALEPLLDHGVTVGEGAGALLALPLVQAAAALAAELPEKPEKTEDAEEAEKAEEAAESEESGVSARAEGSAEPVADEV
jgi:nicotinate-nucleotide--dimethylbenzimidazole phosphoribosyltransferase